MNWIKSIGLGIAFLTITQIAVAQKAELLSFIPDKNKEAFVESEPALLNTIEFLDNTSLLEQEGKRKKQQALLMGWLENSPTVTVTIHSFLLDLTKKNPDFILTYLGGWAKYSIQHEYSKDNVKCGIAGVKSILTYYKKYAPSKENGVIKNKDIEKLIELEKKGLLEKWVQDRM